MAYAKRKSTTQRSGAPSRRPRSARRPQRHRQSELEQLLARHRRAEARFHTETNKLDISDSALEAAVNALWDSSDRLIAATSRTIADLAVKASVIKFHFVRCGGEFISHNAKYAERLFADIEALALADRRRAGEREAAHH